MLILIAIVAVILFLLLPAVSKVRARSQQVACANNLKQLAAGVLSYETVHGRFPPGAWPANVPLAERSSWLVAILPHLDADHGGQPPDPATPLKLTQCPFALPSVATCYLGVAGVGPDPATLPLKDPNAGVFGYDRVVTTKDMRRGGSWTILIAEGVGGGPWSQTGSATVRGFDPANWPHIADGQPWRGFDPQPITVVALADGRVAQVGADLDRKKLELAVTLAAEVQELLPNEWW